VKVLYLARHGETDWNARGKLQGLTDIPLNEAGREQARALAARIEKEAIGALVTSDLSRAAETGLIVADALGVVTRHVDAELRERCFGVFEGLTREECATRHPEAWRLWVEQTVTPEGAETRELAVARMTRALRRVAERSGDAPTLVVSHGGAMRLLLIEWLGVKVPLIANGAVYRVETDGDRFDARLWA